MDHILPGSYLVVALDISVADLTADSNLMEKAHAAAVPVDITPGFSDRTLELSMTRLRQYVVSAPREIQ